ncbi:polysaccharide biosynthesis protein [Halochromatium glycolicum]|uniref:Polysaccharide biosynthesis protein n=1 Tax=Halochromatium glycolicum TaxID=85075 RepID=A0AAJ0U5D1_9GAMM|nr:nucleoside-diphosphate sugar epimerase/dehydratase [Halochromatium glycolicum]MBK1705584.1 polysaccharide biosynthesis protein [Halochromatium glycolicum]
MWRRWYERLRSRTAAFAHDLVMVPVAWLGAFWMRFNLSDVPDAFMTAAVDQLPLVMLICAVVYWSFGLYRGVWRFASLPDLARIAKAVTLATLLVVLALFVLSRNEFLPRSVPPLFLCFQAILLAGPRLLYRRLKDHRLGLRPGERVLVVGADRAGEMLVRDMLRDPGRRYFPVAFVDDKLRRHGGDIHGVPIKGGSVQIPELVESLGIDLIMLAVPTATNAQMQRLVELCESTGRPFRTVPQLKNLLSGAVTIRQLREVSIDDLLGRNPVQLDWAAIRAGLTDRVVLVTGAGGSIGAELCRQILAAQPRRLLLVDNCELNLYRLDHELAGREDRPPYEVQLVDVTDRAAIESLFAAQRPHTVFHAAAYKHVPLLETQVRAAVRNNVLGTETVADCASRHGCERVVLISTDKAVNPANVMGATKRAAEMLCQARAQAASTTRSSALTETASTSMGSLPTASPSTDQRAAQRSTGLLISAPATRFITVRFGNVLGSAGSVVPLFRQQIEQGGPVTVTDPEIERFFMTIPEACQLIMQAALIGAGGEIFVLDMGKPVKIRYLAEQMIRLAGREPHTEIPIEYVGLRPGEKLYEELFYDREDLMQTEHPKIKAARRERIDADSLDHDLRRLRTACDGAPPDELLQLLRELVPEWRTPPATRGDPAAAQPAAERASSPPVRAAS